MIYHQTDRYQIDTFRYGAVSVTRLADKAEIYFQPGDDANGFLEDLMGEPSDDEINIVCDQYADLFNQEEKD